MSKNGKQVTFVDRSLYLQPVNGGKSFFNTEISEIDDGIRYFSSNFWSLKNNLLAKSEITPILKINKINDKENIYTIEGKKDQFVDDVFENGILKRKFSKNLWFDFLNNIIPEQERVFEDFYFEMPELFNLEELNSLDSSNSAFINKEFIYNFFTPKFESLVTNPIFNVNYLPSFLNVLNQYNIETKDFAQNLFLGFGGLIEENFVDTVLTSTKLDDRLKEYFNKYVSAYESENGQTVLRQMKIQNFENKEIVNQNTLSLIKSKKYIPFPFYSEIKFSNLGQDSDFKKFLIENKNLDLLLLAFISSRVSFPKKELVYHSGAEQTEEQQINFFDIKTWINSRIILQETGSQEIFLKPQDVILYNRLLNYIKNNLSLKMRKFKDLTTIPAHKEIIGYKVEKRQVNNDTAQPITTTYISSDDSDIIKYIDTRIKYGQQYYYKIYAYTLVVGTGYSYKPYYTESDAFELENDLNDAKFKIKLEEKPIYNIFEVPISNFNGAVIEAPLTKPQADFELKDDKVFIRLEQSFKNEYEEFKIIENVDFNNFEKIRLSQDNENKNFIKSANKILNPLKLQIYRTTEYPKSYLSFSNKLFKTILLENNLKSFTDSLTPNIKYYYLFRYLNEHDVPSNASDVFEVQLIEEDDYYYLETKKIQLEEPYLKNDSKKFKRYLLIRPSLIQVQPKFDIAAETVDQVTLGPKTKNLWDKQFLLKITSVNSNRVIKFKIKSTIKK